jgi:hypothetical protein
MYLDIVGQNVLDNMTILNFLYELETHQLTEVIFCLNHITSGQKCADNEDQNDCGRDADFRLFPIIVAQRTCRGNWIDR